MRQVDSDLAVMIMAGGAGTRFWPLSTEEKPKPFLTLFGNRSLLQQSVDRVADLVPPERVLVLTNQKLVDQVKTQLPDIPVENIIAEPLRRDTAAAVALGALVCQRRFGNPVILVLPADQVISPKEMFQQTLLSAAAGARESGALYTLGIPPTYPAIGYGYLELGEKIREDQGIAHFRVLKFKEKPDQETAAQYLASGHFLWNSGMFVWTAQAIFRELAARVPGLVAALSGTVRFDRTPDWDQALTRAFETLETISIDFAVMEKASDVRCVTDPFNWSDVGEWPALRPFLPADEAENAFRGRLLTRNARNNLVFCEDPSETVLLAGVEDLIVVRAGSKTLVVHKDRVGEIKELVRDQAKKS